MSSTTLRLRHTCVFLEHLEPRILVGLTATPERADGKSILHYFDDRIACDLRLWQALDEGLLAPFHYFGINDGTDLRDLAFTRGQYGAVSSKGSTRPIPGAFIGSSTPCSRSVRIRGLCEHWASASGLSTPPLWRRNSPAGLPAISLSGKSTAEERARGIANLRRGHIRAIFTVDLFNEGIDIPEVDTVLLLRPTESAAVFLQQLGRGLRHSPGKSVLTVLDFIGQAHRRFRFEFATER